ncbi:MAG: SDR family oxidoreductase [Deltaproteobacteria bacterium]
MKKTDVLICGKGFIGGKLETALGGRAVTTFIRSFADAERLVRRFRPRVLINAIGYTGRRNVDDCERDREGTLTANVFVPLWLAEAAIRHGVKFVHISSGCIYNYDYEKDRPLEEERVPDYFDLFYSRTKIYAERALLPLCGRYGILIVRLRIPLDDTPHPKNLLTKLIAYGKVIELANSVTYVPDFIRAVRFLLRRNARGIYNVVNKGGLRYVDLMEAYRRLRPDFAYERIRFRSLGLKRSNLILSCRKLEKAGFRVRPIRSVLKECVREYVRQVRPGGQGGT